MMQAQDLVRRWLAAYSSGQSPQSLWLRIRDDMLSSILRHEEQVSETALRFFFEFHVRHGVRPDIEQEMFSFLGVGVEVSIWPEEVELLRTKKDALDRMVAEAESNQVSEKSDSVIHSLRRRKDSLQSLIHQFKERSPQI